MMVLDSWEKPESHPALGDDDAHLWLVRVEETMDEACLSIDEQERAARFQIGVARQRFVAARSALRYVLARYLHRDAGHLSFVTGPHGKLALDDDALAFNLSHAGDYALIAVAKRLAVGVDIEHISPARASVDIASRFFSPLEQAQLAVTPTDVRAAAFFRIWSRKEAVIKALGEGLACPLSTFDVSPDVDEARLLAFRREGIEVDDWSMLSIDAAPGYAAALAVIGQIKSVRGFLYWRG
jgi:4'-phosphopantetheinyl transferase